MDQTQESLSTSATQTAAETPASPVETSSPSPATQEASPSPVESGATQPVAPEWRPDFKFKSMGQEFEIDEEYRAYIKSQEDEKKIKRLFEQFKGVDKLKVEKEEYKKKWSEAEPNIKKLENYEMSFGAFNKLIQEGQFKKAFDLFQIPKDIMYKAALQYAEYDELPQEQKQVYNQLQSQESLNAQLYQQYQTTQAQLQQIQTQARTQELQTVLVQPEIKTIAEKYDQAYGAGSFRQQIITRGKQHYAATGEDLTAQQVAEDFVKLVKPFLSQAPAQVTPPAAALQEKDLPVIPATGSSTSTAPGDKQFKSLADIKAYSKQKSG